MNDDYCANGCTTVSDGQRIPLRLTGDPRIRICGRCEKKLSTWLTELPDHYALLPTFLGHGTTEGNPDSKSTKRAVQAAPMRLNVLDLLDTRLGRKWAGTATTGDRRGTIGILQPHVEAVLDGRSITTPPARTVTAYAAFLRRHLLWIAEQEWVADFTTEIKQLHTELANAVGIYRRPPIGRCHVPTDDEGKPCGGPLYASDYAGVHCSRCGATWDAAHLRQLGLAQAAAEQEIA